MYSDELLDMKLNEVSDLLLQKLCESGNDVIKVELPGCDMKTKEHMKLIIFLCKGDEAIKNE